MLKYMTKASFIEAVDQRRFVVKNPKGNVFEVYYISQLEFDQKFSMVQVINPETKNGCWTKNGGGYNKAIDTIESVAYYIDKNAEDKESNPIKCLDYFMNRQNYNII